MYLLPKGKKKRHKNDSYQLLIERTKNSFKKRLLMVYLVGPLFILYNYSCFYYGSASRKGDDLNY